MNPVNKEHVGTFTVGIGGRIKNRKSHDWNVPRAYEKIIDKAMKNLIQNLSSGPTFNILWSMARDTLKGIDDYYDVEEEEV